MSTTIDQRVVEMEFDNKRFESNMATTISSLGKLKDSLNFTGATNGLENISEATKGCDMSILSSAVETVRSKFSALEVMGVTALMNITNSAVNAGKRIASALTIDPIKTGFSEYETQINAVQTILANTESKGKTLDDVNSALDELNTYADKTIYNFTEMTRNIGTFTAAGVDLDTSVSAIKGIANLAAVSGSTSQQASTAMYQLSQALASGTVKLMDWNSVVNAGMGGQVFQDALKETARVHGIAIDDLIAKEGSFRETLSTGWLSSEILTETLSKFTGDLNKEQLKSMGYTEEQIEGILKMGKTANDAATKVKTVTQLYDTLKEAAQSGWTQTWEILVGDFEEAKELLTKVSDVVGGFIGKTAEARNEMLGTWKALGGRSDLIDALGNAFNGLMSVIKPIKDAFTDIFPPLTAEQLFAFTKGLKDLTAKMKLSDTASENLRRTFRGIFAVVDIVRQVLFAAFKAVMSLFGGVDDLGGGILSVTAIFGDWLVRLNEGVKRSDVFNKVLQGIASVLKAVVKVFGKFFGFLGEKVVAPGFELFSALLQRIGTRMGGISKIAEVMKNAMSTAIEAISNAFTSSSLVKFFTGLWNVIKTIGSGIAKVLGPLASGILEKIANINFSGVLDVINQLIKGGIGVALIRFLNKFNGSTSALESLGITDIINAVKGMFEGLVGIFDNLRGCLEAWQTSLKSKTLMEIAKAIALLAASVLVLSLIDSDKLAQSLGAITVLFGDLMASMGIFSRIAGSTKGVYTASAAMVSIATAVLILSFALTTISTLNWGEIARGLVGVGALLAMTVATSKALSGKGNKAIKGAKQMIMFAVAIKVLASAVKDISSLGWGEMAKGLVGVGVLLAEVSLFMNTAKFSNKAVGTATGIVILAAAIKILVSAIKDISQIATGDIGKGLTTIAVLLGELMVFSNLTGNAKHVLSTGVAMIAIAAAMKIFASAISDLGSLSWESIAKGLTAMALALAAVTIAVNFMPANMIVTAAGLVVVATALLILKNALAGMGGMSWEEIGKGLLVLGGALAILAVGLYAMSGTMVGAAALFVAAAALAILTPVLIAMSVIDWGAIALGLLKMAGSLLVVGAASLVALVFVPTLLLLAVLLQSLGIGALLAGAGMIVFAAGMTAMSGAMAIGASAMVTYMTTLVTGFANMIPMIATKIGEGLLAICKTITEGAPVIGEAVVSVILAIVDTLDKVIPPLMDTIGMLLDELIALLVEYVPKLAEAGMKIILGVLEGISSHIADIVDVALEIIANFLKGIGMGLPKIIDAAINLVIDFINGMANSIRTNTPKMIAAVDNLMDAVIDAIGQWFKHATTSGLKLTGKLSEGIKDGVSGIIKAGKDAAAGFIEGIKAKFTAVKDAAVGLGKKALDAIKNVLGINSPAKELIDVGVYSDEGLIIGFKKLAGKVASTAGGVGDSALTSMKSALSGISAAINGDLDTTPVISPVMDLSNVRSGVGALNGMLAFDSSVGMSANLGAISASMSNHNQNGGNGEIVSAINKLRKDIGSMGNTYQINGVTYDDGSNISDAVKSIVRAARIERRV